MTNEYEGVRVLEVRTFEVPRTSPENRAVNKGTAAALAENMAGPEWGGAQVEPSTRGTYHFWRVSVRRAEFVDMKV
jgi:hypothetical protein